MEDENKDTKTQLSLWFNISKYLQQSYSFSAIHIRFRWQGFQK